jgi:hypothetical protein
LTSYLVQEPQLAMNAPSPMMRFEGARQAASARAAVSLAAVDAMRDSASSVSASGAGMRQAGGRTFVRRGDAWVDTRYHESERGRVVRVRPYSAGYFALLDAAPALAPWLALGDHVVVSGRGVVVRVEDGGAEMVTADEVAAVRVGW